MHLEINKYNCRKHFIASTFLYDHKKFRGKVEYENIIKAMEHFYICSFDNAKGIVKTYFPHNALIV